MNKRIVMYADAPQGISTEIAKGEVVADFLSPPEEMVRKESKIKCTIALNSGSVSLRKQSPVALRA